MFEASEPASAPAGVPGWQLPAEAGVCDGGYDSDRPVLSDEDLDWIHSVGLSLPAAKEVLAAAGGPVTPGLVVSLADIDPREVSDEVRVALAVAWDRVRNYATARLAEVVAADVDANSDVTAADGRVLVDAERQSAAELGAALRLGSGAADQLVHVSTTLAHRLTATAASMRQGETVLGQGRGTRSRHRNP